jgi:hypothetical protein
MGGAIMWYGRKLSFMLPIVALVGVYGCESLSLMPGAMPVSPDLSPPTLEQVRSLAPL